MKVNKIVLGAALALFAALPVLGMPGSAQAFPVHQLHSQNFGGDFGHPSDYIYSIGTITIDDADVSEIFDFTADATNDVYWYPGVVNVVKTSPTTYEQTLDFGGGFTLTSFLEILDEQEDKYVIQKATGAFENYAIYRYRQIGNKVRYSTYAAVKEGEGIDPETIKFIQETAYGQLLNHLDKTGSYTVSVF